MKVADFIINHLADQGIDSIFEVYGGANGNLIDAFTRTKKTRYISVLHEQAGGFAAEAYSKISGKVGTAIATSGPGAQNFVTPIANCFYDSVPALFLTGQVKTQFLRSDPSIRQVGFQECDVIGIVNGITKFSKMVTNPATIKHDLEKALFMAQDGRPGPVLLDLPIDVQKAEVDIERLVGFNAEASKTDYDLDSVDKKIDYLLKDLCKSKRPVMFIGAGVRIAGAVNDLIETGNRLKIPLFPSWNALDIVTSDNPFYGGRVGTFGGAGRNLGVQNSDLFLNVGSRLSGRVTGSNLESFARGAKKYCVDIDRALLQPSLQQIPFDENIRCDAKIFLKRLNSKLNETKVPDFNEWHKQVQIWRQKYDIVKSEYFKKDSNKGYTHPYAFMRILSEEMKNNDIFIGDCGGNIVVSSHAFETKQGQRFLTNNGNSPMGFSYAASMGADIAAREEQNVVCVIGDGGFNMNIQEMQTVKNYGLDFKTFILNNHCYGITREFQRNNFEGRMEACGPIGYNPPNFLEIAKAYGLPTETIRGNNPDEIRGKVRDVLNSKEAIICDVDIGDWDTYGPRIIGWNTPLEDVTPYLPRDEFKANLIGVEPLPGWEKPDY